MENSQQIAHMKFVYGDDDAQLVALLSESLAPRPPDFLLDLAIPLLTPDSRLLDVGCRDARHLIPLVMRSGCTGVGIDPVERNIDRARAAVTAADLDQRIEIRRGVMEQTDEPDSSIDVVWCRDVLEVIPDLQAGLSEVARVLKPGGSAVIYTVFATPRLEPREAAAVNQPLGSVPQNLERAWVEEAFKQAGFRVERLEEIGTEFREYEEERTQPVSESLLRLARLRRRRKEVIQRFGRDKYNLWEASLHWLAYLLMGRWSPSPTSSACPSLGRHSATLAQGAALAPRASPGQPAVARGTLASTTVYTATLGSSGSRIHAFHSACDQL